MGIQQSVNKIISNAAAVYSSDKASAASEALKAERKGKAEQKARVAAIVKGGAQDGKPND